MHLCNFHICTVQESDYFQLNIEWCLLACDFSFLWTKEADTSAYATWMWYYLEKLLKSKHLRAKMEWSINKNKPLSFCTLSKSEYYNRFLILEILQITKMHLNRMIINAIEEFQCSQEKSEVFIQTLLRKFFLVPLLASKYATSTEFPIKLCTFRNIFLQKCWNFHDWK